MNAQTFSGITPAIKERLAAKLDTDYGIQITGDSGSAEHSGFAFTYNYNPTTQILVIQVTKKPLLVPSSVVMHGVVEHVADAISKG